MTKRITSKDVPCPTCSAQPGQSCRGSVTGSSRGRPVQSHWKRVDAAKVARAEAGREATAIAPVTLLDFTRGTVEEIDGSTPPLAARGARAAETIAAAGEGYVLASLGTPPPDDA